MMGLQVHVACGEAAAVGFDAYLTRGGQEVNHLLNSASSMHVQGDGDEIVRHRLADEVALLICREFKQFLTKVVAKGI
jgi:hypothetical protein